MNSIELNAILEADYSLIIYCWVNIFDFWSPFQHIEYLPSNYKSFVNCCDIWDNWEQLHHGHDHRLRNSNNFIDLIPVTCIWINHTFLHKNCCDVEWEYKEPENHSSYNAKKYGCLHVCTFWDVSCQNSLLVIHLGGFFLLCERNNELERGKSFLGEAS